MKPSCNIPDCPERTGGTCWRSLVETKKEVVRELRAIRENYRHFKLDDAVKVSDVAWRIIFGIIDDRIEELTGTRV